MVCYEQKNRRHSVSVKDGTLIIEVNDTRKWYEYIGIFFDSPKVTVYIPQGAYGSLTIESSTGDVDIPKDFTFESMDISENTGDVTNRASVAGIMKVSTSTGHIHVEGLSAGAMELSVSTGRVTVSDVTCEGDVRIRVSTGDTRLTNVACQSFTTAGSTGDISLTNVIAVERFSIERSTGDVKIDACDAAEICIKTDTGDVEGRLLSDKVFLVKTDTGHINVPHSITGGRCEITTDTGNICVTVEK